MLNNLCRWKGTSFEEQDRGGGAGEEPDHVQGYRK